MNDNFDKILSTEYSEHFDELRKKAMITSYYKYGPLKTNYSQGYIKCIESLEKRLKAYKETGNTEFLVDIANFAMIEFMNPQHTDAKYQPTDSKDCPGVVGMGVNEIKNFDNEL